MEPRQGTIVAVPPLLGGGPPWYVDSRLVPNPGAVAYWDRREWDRANKGRCSDLWDRPEVVILDRSVTELAALWEKVLLVESRGPSPENPGLPPRGVYMGRLGLYAQSGFEAPPTYALVLVSEEVFDAEPLLGFGPFDSPREPGRYTREEPIFRLGVYSPPLMSDEMQALAAGPSYDDPVKRKAYFDCLGNLEERAKREFPLPGGIVILGRVLDWFRPPEEDGESE